jgi:hypothetical protein
MRYHNIFVAIVFTMLSYIVFGNKEWHKKSGTRDHNILDGITESSSFVELNTNKVPVWKKLKDAADFKADSLQIQEALKSYSELLKDKLLFNKMPSESRYDVFLSMAKLLKLMGFHRRAELLLYESMSYTMEPFDAHLQLGILALDREDLAESKMHMKNCLYYKAEDITVLSYLSIALIAEGRLHEAKFFVSRLLSTLEVRVRKLLRLMGRDERDIVSIAAKASHGEVSRWLEEMMTKALHGQLTITTSTNIEMIKMFSNVYTLLADGDIKGRFAFDLGQSLYEGGRPITGSLMMQRGHKTSEHMRDGVTSYELISTRLAIEFPTVPADMNELLGRYLNLTNFLSNTVESFSSMDIENALDIYWSLPLLGWSGLGVASIQSEILRRFKNIPIRRDPYGRHFLSKFKEPSQIITTENNIINNVDNKLLQADTISISQEEAIIDLGEDYDHETIDVVVDGKHMKVSKQFAARSPNHQLKPPKPHMRNHRTRSVLPKDNLNKDVIDEYEKKKNSIDQNQNQNILEVGIFGGHMNSHPIGQAILTRLLAFSKDHAHAINKEHFRLTLLALPLVPDNATQRIAKSVHRIVNLPVDMSAAWLIIEGLYLDVLLIPDWQPFPDTHSVLFSSARIAPLQICFYVRGSPCPASASMDYYLLPEELEDLYLNDVPAVSAAPDTWSWSQGNSNDDAANELKNAQWKLKWLAPFMEQVILVPDWPIITGTSIKQSAISVKQDKIKDNNSTLSDDTFVPSEVEGQVNFGEKPTAILPMHPSQVHTLMDELLLNILQASSSLHIILVLPASYFSHSDREKRSEYKICWARALVRRLWKRDFNLYNRIRLLPDPLSDLRLLQLYRQADMVLDSFPVGISSFYLELALSIGTPVVTMKTGTKMNTPHADLLQLRKIIGSKDDNHTSCCYPPRSWWKHGDIPWRPSVSTIHGFYKRVGIDRYLSATSLEEYFAIATRLALDRDYAYNLRIKILDAVDVSINKEESLEGEIPSAKGLWDFISRVGSNWARIRTNFISSPASKAAIQVDHDEAKNKRRRAAAVTE